MSNNGPKTPPTTPLKGTAHAIVYTWGTHENGGNGMAHYLDSQLTGGNVGHASIAITFPADEKGLELIKNYCMAKDGTTVKIPFMRKQQETKDEKGNVITTEVYQVYFSWWPNADKTGFTLKQSMNEDREEERAGVDQGPIDPNRSKPGDPNALQPLETRVYHGKLGSKKMHLAPKEMTANIGSIPPEHQQLLQFESQIKILKDKKDTLDVILKKLPKEDSDTSKVKVEGSLEKLLNENVKDWQTSISDYDPKKKTLNKAQIKQLTDKINAVKKECDTEIKPIKFARDNAIIRMRKIDDRKIAKEVEGIREYLTHLHPADQRRAIQDKKGFNPRAWIAFELQELEKPVERLSDFGNFTKACFQAEDEIGVFSNAIFHGTFPNVPATQNEPERPYTEEEKANILSVWREYTKDLRPRVTADILKENPSILQKIKIATSKEKGSLNEKRHELENQMNLVRLQDPLNAGDYERIVSRGLSADNAVVLGIGGIKAGEQFGNGLNVEQMLIKIGEITAKGEKFDLDVNNCSVTTGAILAAGAGKEHASYFQKRAWGGFGNPQEVYNGAKEYCDVIVGNNGKKPFLDKAAAYNPLNVVTWAGGSILKGLNDPNTSTGTKVALGAAGILVAPIVGLTETAKALANPKKTALNCLRFCNYAWSNNSTTLKVCSAPVAVLGGLLTIPALAQKGITMVTVDPIQSLIAKNESKKRAQDPNKPTGNTDPKVEEKVNVQNISVPAGTMNTRMAVELQADLAALEDSKKTIGVFTPRTEQRVYKAAEKSDTVRVKLVNAAGKALEKLKGAMNPTPPLPPTPRENVEPPPLPRPSIPKLKLAESTSAEAIPPQNAANTSLPVQNDAPLMEPINPLEVPYHRERLGLPPLQSGESPENSPRREPSPLMFSGGPSNGGSNIQRKEKEKVESPLTPRQENPPLTYSANSNKSGGSQKSVRFNVPESKSSDEPQASHRTKMKKN